MADVTYLEPKAVNNCRIALQTALEVLQEYQPQGVLIVMKAPERGVYVHFNEDLRADGAIVLCEVEKAMSLQNLLGDEDD